MSQRLPADTRIIFDTNVLISVFVFKQEADKVYQYYSAQYNLCTTQWILNELQNVLGRNKFKLPQHLQNEIIDQIRIDSLLFELTNDLPTDSPDPDDNNVLRAALFIHAGFLITGDAKHLLPLKRVGNTEVISPRDFYERYIA